jgi:hypothetical protein
MHLDDLLHRRELTVSWVVFGLAGTVLADRVRSS